jgi:uncharacterized membrane protein
MMMMMMMMIIIIIIIIIIYSVVQIRSDKFRGTVREPCGTKRIRNPGI